MKVIEIIKCIETLCYKKNNLIKDAIKEGGEPIGRIIYQRDITRGKFKYLLNSKN